MHNQFYTGARRVFFAALLLFAALGLFAENVEAASTYGSKRDGQQVVGDSNTSNLNITSPRIFQINVPNFSPDIDEWVTKAVDEVGKEVIVPFSDNTGKKLPEGNSPVDSSSYVFYDPNLGQNISVEDKEAADFIELLAWQVYLKTHDPAAADSHPDSKAWADKLTNKQLDPKDLLAQAQMAARWYYNNPALTDLGRDNAYLDYLGKQVGGMANAEISGTLAALSGLDSSAFSFTVNLGSGKISDGAMSGSFGGISDGYSFNLTGGSGSAGSDSFRVSGFTGTATQNLMTHTNVGNSFMQGSSPDNFETVTGNFAVQGGDVTIVEGTLSGNRK